MATRRRDLASVDDESDAHARFLQAERWRKQLEEGGFRVLEQPVRMRLLRHAPGSSANLVPTPIEPSAATSEECSGGGGVRCDGSGFPLIEGEDDDDSAGGNTTP